MKTTKTLQEKLIPVIVRSHLAGVFFGYSDGTHDVNRIDLVDARHFYGWSGALNVDTIAAFGANEKSRLTTPISQTVYGPIVQVIPCTPEAETSLKAIAVAR